MNEKPFGRCPYCRGELEIEEEDEGSFLVCPAGDYRAEAAAYDQRWRKFANDSGDLAEPLDGITLADTLLRDLRALNTQETDDEEST
jgi:hypothetical protein